MDYWIQLNIRKKPKEAENKSASAPSNWMQENHPLLLDMPVEEIDPSLSSREVVSVKDLKIKQAANHYVLDHDEGQIQLKQGDILDYGDFFVHVNYIYPTQARSSENFQEYDDRHMVFSSLEGSHLHLTDTVDEMLQRERAINENKLPNIVLSQDPSVSMDEKPIEGYMSHSFLSMPERPSHGAALHQPAFSLPLYQSDTENQNFNNNQLDTLNVLGHVPDDHDGVEQLNLDDVGGTGSDRSLDDIEKLYFDQPVTHTFCDDKHAEPVNKKLSMSLRIRKILGG